MAQRIFQDPAGTIPAILAGQPVGLVKRMAGTVDATQATALSKPTLARWPMSGVRNLANGAQAGGNAAFWPSSGISLGTAYTKVGSGVSEGKYYVDYRLTGDSTASGLRSVYLSSNSEFPAGPGSVFTASAEVEVIAGAGSLLAGEGIRVEIASRDSGGAQIQNSISPVYGGSGFSTITASLGGAVAGTTNVRSQVGIRLEARSGVDVTIRIRNYQFMAGASISQPQNNFGINDITEPGVADLWHLYNDGGDSLTCVLPAGTYGVANLAIDRSYRFDTLVSDGSTPITTLTSERQIDALYRLGALSPAEQLAMIDYWTKEYPL